MVIDQAQLIGRSSLLQNLTPAQVDGFIRLGHQKSFTKGDQLFTEGDSATLFYILLSGEIKLTQVSIDGQQIIIDYLSPGSGFGIVAVLSQMVYPVTAEAVTDALVIYWDRTTTKHYMLQHAQMAINSMEMISGRFMMLQHRFRELATKRVEQRLARTILRLTNQFGRRNDEGILIDLPLSQQDLAEMTGTTLYTVSRVLKKWSEQGIVKSGRQCLTLQKSHALVKIADEPVS